MSRQELVRKALAALESDGRLTAEDVVRAARTTTSPLHEFFEWDDEKAAHEHRLGQARALIRSVQVRVTTDEGAIVVPQWVEDPNKERGAQGYVSLDRLRSEPETANSMLRSELIQVEARMTRAVQLSEALGLKPRTQAVARRVRTLRQRVEAVSALAPA